MVKHKNSLEYKLNVQCQSFIDDIKSDESVHNDDPGSQLSLGSSVSAGGLIDKDLDNLEDKELVKTILQRRHNRRDQMEATR